MYPVFCTRSYTYTRGHPRMRVINLHIYVCMHNAYYISNMQVISIHTYNPTLLLAAIPTHVDAHACVCANVCANTRARAGGPVARNDPRRIDGPLSASRRGGANT